MKTITRIPRIIGALDLIKPGFGSVYSRNFSGSSEPNTASYTQIQKISEEESQGFVSGLSKKIRIYPYGTKLDLTNTDVHSVKTADIELKPEDKFGQIIFVSKSGANLRYGHPGIAPSKSKSPLDLLVRNLVIPEKSFGVIDVAKHVPFLLEANNPKDAFALSVCQLEKVYEHEDNIKRYSISTVGQLTKDDAKRLSLVLQNKIFQDYQKEDFYEEVTSKVYKPTEYNQSSGTLMSFEKDGIETDETTAMHYHPGERSLHIITTNKASGVTLNFCGINENPDSREDCEVHLSFPRNSMVVLNFPPYTHHKFHGEFVCMSVHPREGINLIEAVNSGTLPRGFLESATVFSPTSENQEKWQLSLPRSEVISQEEYHQAKEPKKSFKPEEFSNNNSITEKSRGQH